MAAKTPTGTVWIDVVTSHPVVAAGIAKLLEGRHETRVVRARGPHADPPDVVFYDVIGLHEQDGKDLDRLVIDGSAVVVAVTRPLRPDLGAAALERGAQAAISLAASREDFLEVVEAALTDRLLTSPAAQDAQDGTRVGNEVGLTLREADVVAMIVRGLSNREIAEACCLSINSVKSYIRSAYRKMDVPSRSQAVKWGVQHGFALDADPAEAS